MIFIQREGTTGTVTFTGDMARILDSQGQVVVDWTAGGSLTGVPQGSGYRLEVRTGSTVVADELAIGAVVFTLGQSNIQRWFDGPAEATGNAIYSMDGDGKIGPVSGSGAAHFANIYAAELGVPVLLVEGAKGGTSLVPEADKGNGNWLSTATGGLYDNALNLLERVGGSAEVVLWGQGETDGAAGVPRARYEAALTELMNRILQDFSPAQVLIQEIGPHGTSDGGTDSKYDAVRAAQHAVADALAGVDIGAEALDLNTLPDGIHLSGASRILAADRMVISALALEGIDISRPVWTGADDADAGDTHAAGDGRDELRGLAGDDTLDGGAGDDVVLAGAGDDSLLGGDGLDIMRGDAGHDTLEGGAGDDVLSGGDDHDSLLGGAGADEIWGDAGDDSMAGGTGNDLLYGGAGDDVAIYAGLRAGYSVVVANGSVTVQDIDPSDGDEGRDVLADVELLRFSDVTIDPDGSALPSLFTGNADFVDFATVTNGTYMAVSLYRALDGNDEVYLPATTTAALAAGYDTSRSFDAGAGDDVVIGGALKDTILGGDGADILNGGSGVDRLEGGRGDDLYYVDNKSDVIVEKAGEGIDTVIASASFTLKSNIENLVLAGTAALGGTGNAEANVLTGNAGANKLLGQAGDDTIWGGDGGDTLDGGTGADSLTGGAGDDRYLIDDAGDVVVELAGGGSDTVQSSIGFALPEQVERLTLLGVADLWGTGGAGDDRLDGNSGNNLLSGLAGHDSLYGLAGDDVLNGGAGNDTLDGGVGNDAMTGGAGDDRFLVDSLADQAVEDADGGYDTVQTTVSFSLGGNIERLTAIGGQGLALTGNDIANRIDGSTGHDLIEGGAGNDSLYGLDGNDTLRGGDGNDTLEGGVGADRMAGGNGADRFVFRALADLDAGDVVADFGRGDRIDLSKIDAIASSGSDDAFVFIGAAASTAAGQLRAEQDVAGNRTIVSGHVNADGIADFELILTGLFTLASTDFAL